MKTKILKYLKQLEQENDIKILLACETGSRAWGFPSPDSDYDIRLIYVHKKDWYLSLNEKKDTIDCMFENNDIDISGWDLRKSLRLLQKSNAALLERIQSPILYQVTNDFIIEINELSKTQYSKIATMHHYLSMSKKFLADLKENKDYKLKKFFYALRSATACKWILEKEENPPIEFLKMIDGLAIETNLIKRILELIELKSTISESYLHKGEIELFKYIEDCIEKASEQKNVLPSSSGKMSDLDTFFIKTITQNDH